MHIIYTYISFGAFYLKHFRHPYFSRYLHFQINYTINKNIYQSISINEKLGIFSIPTYLNKYLTFFFFNQNLLAAPITCMIFSSLVKNKN